MDPLDPASFNLETVKLATGRLYECCDQIPSHYVHDETPVLLLLHGFPELWYDWRYQIGPWVRRGWRVIAPSMLGYSGTDKPDDPALYTPLSLAGELAGLLDALDIKQTVVLIAHDWGSTIAWAFATRYTERTRAIVSLSIPYTPPVPKSFTPQELVAIVGVDLMGYRLFFCSDDGPTKIQSNIPLFVDALYRTHNTMDPKIFGEGTVEKLMSGEIPYPGPSDLMSEKERKFQIETLERGGIDKPLNYFRQTPYTFKIQEAHTRGYAFSQSTELKLNPILPATLPALIIAPNFDPYSAPDRIEKSKAFVPSLEVTRVDGAHFVMLEKREEVTQIVGDWLQKKLKTTK
ncbi:hypothetical protein FRB97_002182 [Tulasnella sp. 331]|nr:hypothetical protein FRB97_002182 [Tulasnella sp. 331]